MRDLFGGQSMIVDHRGNVIVKQPGMANGDSFVSAVLDVEALRRARLANGVTSWFKDLRTERPARRRGRWPGRRRADFAHLVCQ